MISPLKPSAPPRPLSARSLTGRLTLLFAGAAGSVLLALGWVLASAIEHHFLELDTAQLNARLAQTQQIVDKLAATAELDRLPGQLATSLAGHEDMALAVRTADGDILMASASLAALGPLPPQPDPVVRELAGHPYRILTRPLAPGLPGQPPLVASIALDLRHHEHFMAAFARTLWGFVALAALASGTLGWLAARRGLAPLRAMGRRAAAITAHKLDQRIDASQAPAELASFAHQLNAMLERLEDAFTRLSDFSSDLAHELRTPIGNLMTQTQVALSRPRDAEVYRDTLASNAEEFERLARMVDDMLLLAKAENGLGLARCETVDLYAEAVSLCEFYGILAEEKAIELHLSGRASVEGDRLMLRRAMANLITNALRHARPGSTIRFALADEGRMASIALTNEGDTIAPERLPQLFTRFYRADPARQHRDDGGAGLGLAITRAIVLGHGGTVEARSLAGLTCFTLRLPVHQNGSADRRPT